MPIAALSSVRKEENFREAKAKSMERQTIRNEEGKVAHDHMKADFIDQTKAEFEPLLRQAIPAGEHMVEYGKRTFIGFPGFGRGKIAHRRKLCISSQLN